VDSVERVLHMSLELQRERDKAAAANGGQSPSGTRRSHAALPRRADDGGVLLIT